MTTVEILRKARALIKNGWCQLSMKQQLHGRTQYCALGALRTASTRFQYATVYPILHDAIGAGSIMVWNDATDRTKAEVLAAYDRAIKAASKVKPCESCSRPSSMLWRVKVTSGGLEDSLMVCAECGGFDPKDIEPDYEFPLVGVSR